jgi:sialate O-acetylesterase
MAMSVSRALNPEPDIASAKYPQIRLFTAQRTAAPTKQEDCLAANQGGWVACSPETVGAFSAAGYFFGRELHQQLETPIGLINTSWGGTRAEAWTSRESLEAVTSLKPLLDHWDERVANWNAEAAAANYERQQESWKAAAARAKSQGKPAPRRPAKPAPPATDRHRPANLFNGMIAPFLNLSIRGAIWYQGEANVPRASQYHTLFPTMIQDWRRQWGRGDFPFLFVQLAPYRYSRHDSPEFCAELWETQRQTLLRTPNTGMAVTTDIGNVKDIHPKNKQEVGRRLALWALAKTYGRDLVCSGPLYDSMTVEANKIRLKFKYVGGGLTAKDGGPLTHFTIAGKNKEFVPATAVIDGDTVLVHSDSAPNPVAVRFAWTDTAEPNFFNEAGLPASPFRTDDFPLLTKGTDY